jgi:hypothetical protein
MIMQIDADGENGHRDPKPAFVLTNRTFEVNHDFEEWD